MEQPADIALFQRLREEDRLALNTLFATYYQQLCRFACSYSLTHEQAEEVVADVFFTLWKNRARIEIHSHVRAYLYTCVKHAAMNVIRLANREVAYTDQHDTVDCITPEAEFEYHELHDQLTRVVDKLPARCRQIFMMNRFDGLKYREISAILGLSEKTIEHQMAKAMEIVRSAFLVHKKRTALHKSVTVS